MPYATFLDIQKAADKERLGNLLPAASAPFLEGLIRAAEGTIDAALARRYTVPVDTSLLSVTAKPRVDALLRHMATVIALYQGVAIHSGGDPPKMLKAEYERILKELAEYHSGARLFPYLALASGSAIKVAGDRASDLTEELFATSRLLP